MRANLFSDIQRPFDYRAATVAMRQTVKYNVVKPDFASTSPHVFVVTENGPQRTSVVSVVKGDLGYEGHFVTHIGRHLFVYPDTREGETLAARVTAETIADLPSELADPTNTFRLLADVMKYIDSLASTVGKAPHADVDLTAMQEGLIATFRGDSKSSILVADERALQTVVAATVQQLVAALAPEFTMPGADDPDRLDITQAGFEDLASELLCDDDTAYRTAFRQAPSEANEEASEDVVDFLHEAITDHVCESLSGRTWDDFSIMQMLSFPAYDPDRHPVILHKSSNLSDQDIRWAFDYQESIHQLAEMISAPALIVARDTLNKASDDDVVTCFLETIDRESFVRHTVQLLGTCLSSQAIRETAVSDESVLGDMVSFSAIGALAHQLRGDVLNYSLVSPKMIASDSADEEPEEALHATRLYTDAVRRVLNMVNCEALGEPLSRVMQASAKLDPREIWVMRKTFERLQGVLSHNDASPDSRNDGPSLRATAELLQRLSRNGPARRGGLS